MAVDAGRPGDSACYGLLGARLICEGFEASVIPGIWGPTTMNGSATRVGSPAYRGLGALEGRITAAGGKGFIGRPGLGARTSGSLYLRAYLYVGAGPPLRGLTALGLFGPTGGVSVLLMDAGVAVVLQPKGAGIEEVVVTASANPYVIPRNAWRCAQFEIGIGAATTGTVRVLVDGQLAVERAGLNTLPVGGYDAVLAGVIYSDPQQEPIQVVVDELVADTSPIPCQ
jgi:hypothetical protein